MAGTRKAPQLRFDGRYFVVNVYTPEGKRTSISFGPPGERSRGEIYSAFGKWLDLYEQHPHKVLSFKSPYEAIEGVVSRITVTTVGDLMEKYRVHIEQTKRRVRHDLEHPDLRFVRRVQCFLELFKEWPLDSFGPNELLKVQKAMVKHEYIQGKKKKRYTRRGINDNLKWIRKVWRWGMGRQLVSAESVQGLEEVRPLKMGATEAPDNQRRKRVTEDEFQKVVAKTSSIVGDMLKLIWCTGMRPYEVCEMRPIDIVRDDVECWLYIPGRDRTPVGDHKTTHFERVKVIPLTAEAQKILASRLKNTPSKQYIFSPEEAVQQFLAKRLSNRKTPLSCGNRPGTNRRSHPLLRPGKHYAADTFNQACRKACKRAGVEPFSPYDLRRTMATATRSILGKEAARVLLGHAKTDTTEIYLLEEVQESIKTAKLLAAKREQL